MIRNKGALGALLLSFVLSAFVSNVNARIQFDAFGGELEMEGFLKSETRTHMFAGKTHMGQWIQKFQLEAALSYTDVGIFDELTFVTVLRPEYDVIQDLGSLSSGRIGDGSDKPSKANRAVFNAENDALGFGGFDFACVIDGCNRTGGIGKTIDAGLATLPQFAEQFEVDFRRSVTGDNVQNLASTGSNFSDTGSGFPLVVQKASNLNLDCARCSDINVDNHKVAMGMTDSNGKFYPFRELYMDGVIGDFWIRFGKQQIVWGKTDFFRMQDLINPIDYGQHFFFDSMEDIRIPQWMLSVQYKAGEIGPLTDNAFQFVWNFDQFARVGLGNPSQMWAHPFSKDMSTFGIYNTFFSKEPCVTRQMTNNFDGSTMDSGVATAFLGNGAPTVMNPADFCGGVFDNRSPAGFGTPSGLSVENRPDWEPANTEFGWRWEFRVSDFRFALSHWYGWNDIPVFKFHTVNLVSRHLNMSSVLAEGLNVNNVLIGDIVAARSQAGATVNFTEFARNSIAAGNHDPFAAFGFNDAVFSVTPQQAVEMLARHGGAGAASGRNYQALAANALATGRFADILNGIATGAVGGALDFAGNGSCHENASRVFCSPFGGGQTSIEYKQSHTVGLSMDYFEPRSGVVMRIESAWTFDQLVNNTEAVDWVDKSDVMAFSLGFDRPTFIPLLNKDRTFFLSLQIFDTWYWDHVGDKNTGMFVDEHNWITTFFFIGNYMRDTVKPIGFYVWEEASNSHVAGFNIEWLINNNWSMKGGFHLIWEGDNNFTHDTGPYANFIHIGANGNRPDASGQFPYVQSVFGVGREGIGALRNYDEVFFEIKYQF